jgi:hypothetical protein
MVQARAPETVCILQPSHVCTCLCWDMTQTPGSTISRCVECGPTLMTPTSAAAALCTRMCPVRTAVHHPPAQPCHNPWQHPYPCSMVLPPGVTQAIQPRLALVWQLVVDPGSSIAFANCSNLPPTTEPGAAADTQPATHMLGKAGPARTLAHTAWVVPTGQCKTHAG